MADISQEQVVDYLSNLPVIQIAGLIKTLEDKWGVKASAPVVMGGGGAGPAPVVEKAAKPMIVSISTLPEITQKAGAGGTSSSTPSIRHRTSHRAAHCTSRCDVTNHCINNTGCRI